MMRKLSSSRAATLAAAAGSSLTMRRRMDARSSTALLRIRSSTNLSQRLAPRGAARSSSVPRTPQPSLDIGSGDEVTAVRVRQGFFDRGDVAFPRTASTPRSLRRQPHLATCGIASRAGRSPASVLQERAPPPCLQTEPWNSPRLGRGLITKNSRRPTGCAPARHVVGDRRAAHVEDAAELRIRHLHAAGLAARAAWRPAHASRRRSRRSGGPSP